MTELITFPTGKQHVSYSEIKNWSECAYRHKLSYVDKKSVFEASVHTVFGTAVHASCEHYVRHRELKPEIAKDIIRQGWIKHDFDNVEEWLDTADQILIEVPPFLDENFPDWEVVEAEEMLYESIDNHDLNFKGYIDAVIRAPDKKGNLKYWILDWKTTSWGWHVYKKRDFKVNTQLLFYKLYWSMKHDVPEDDVKIGFVLLKRAASAGKRCELLKVSFGPKSRARALKLIDSMIRSVRSSMWLKNRLSCKYCEFFNTEHCT